MDQICLMKLILHKEFWIQSWLHIDLYKASCKIESYNIIEQRAITECELGSQGHAFSSPQGYTVQC